jgi:hypothetical protein
MALASARMIERIDGVVRRWPSAGLCLLAVAIIFGAAMVAAG